MTMQQDIRQVILDNPLITVEELADKFIVPELEGTSEEFRRFAMPPLRDHVRRLFREYSRQVTERYQHLSLKEKAIRLADPEMQTEAALSLTRELQETERKLSRLPVRYHNQRVNWEELTIGEATRLLQIYRAAADSLTRNVIQPLDRAVALLAGYPAGTRLGEIEGWAAIVHAPGALVE